ncbi:MAG: hypothetical protein U9Q76_10520 [candidate division WOR-3 bacterium]|nr:hypothetical protein [candidate division WOR-3 bacterium]
MLFLLFSALGLNTPPNFPQLPPGYEWKEYGSHTIPDEYYDAYRPDYNLPVLKDSSSLPYTFELGDLKFDLGKGDSLYGGVRYTANPTRDLYSLDYSKGILWVDWGVHKEQDLTPNTLLNYYLVRARRFLIMYFLALPRTPVEQISIGNQPAYRIRSYWWHHQCDGAGQRVGSLTFYFIPTERWDIQISCVTSIYTFTAGPPPGLDPEVADSLRAIWKPEKNYPNNIAELERAVEQTFRVKE